MLEVLLTRLCVECPTLQVQIRETVFERSFGIGDINNLFFALGLFTSHETGHTLTQFGRF